MTTEKVLVVRHLLFRQPVPEDIQLPLSSEENFYNAVKRGIRMNHYHYCTKLTKVKVISVEQLFDTML